MFKKTFTKCTGLVLAVTTMFSSTAFAGPALKGFFDCNDHWAITEIDVMTKAGVVNGVGGNRFNPDGTVTRAEFVSMAARAVGIESVSYNNAFNDIKGGEWYAPVVQAAYDAKLINQGMITGGSFAGNTPITREEMASVIMGAYSVMSGNPFKAADLSTYSDFNQISGWAIDDLKGAVSLGIMNGATETTLNPLANATRAEAVVMLFRLFNYAEGNLLDGDFSDDEGGWQCTLRNTEETLNRRNATGTVARIDTDGNFGAGCIMYDIVESGHNYVNALAMTTTIKSPDGGNVLEKGKSYHLSFYAKVEGLDSYVVNQAFFSEPSNRDNKYTEDEKSLTMYGDKWTHYHMYFDATQTAETAKLWFWLGGDRQENFKVYFDDFRFEEVNAYVPVGIYFDDEFAGKVNVSQGGTFAQGEYIDISASVKPGYNYIFSGWGDAYENIVSESSNYSVEASGNVVMKANFMPYTVVDYGFSAPEGEPDCTISAPVADNNQITVNADITVPSGWSVMEAGAVLFDSDMENGLNIFTEAAVVVRPENVNSDGTFTVSAYADEFEGDIRAKGFAIARDTLGNVHTIYSETELYTAPEQYEEKHYRLAYNHELLVAYVASYANPPWDNGFVNAADWFARYIADIENTDVDVVMFCPQCHRTLGWDSDVDTTLREPVRPEVTEFAATYQRHRATIEAGVDPVALTLAGAEEYGKDIFASFRMNDFHDTHKKGYNSHNNFWRDHPEYWFYDSDANQYQRLFNYMIPEVREYYYSIIEEFLTRYDVDGLELDFIRSGMYFYPDEVKKGIPVMNDFVGRIRTLLDKVGREKGKYLPLSVRIPDSIDACLAIGLDPVTWNEQGLVDILNISSANPTTLELDVEGFMENTEDVDIMAELTWGTYIAGGTQKNSTNENYAATIYNYLERGVDGFSIFNMNWLKADTMKSTAALHRILNPEVLKKKEKHYVMGTGLHKGGPFSKIFPAKGGVQFDMIVPDDTSSGIFKKALLWVELEFNATDEDIDAYVNGIQCELLPYSVDNLFTPPQADTYVPELKCTKLYTVPLTALKPGNNTFEVKINSEGKCGAILGVELGLYHNE